jgi:hypothetical protein
LLRMLPSVIGSIWSLNPAIAIRSGARLLTFPVPQCTMPAMTDRPAPQVGTESWNRPVPLQPAPR